MSNHEDKYSYYQHRYGKDAWLPQGERPNYDKCAHNVVRWHKGKITERQCIRKCGHGPGGAFCAQHAKQRETKE